MHGANLDALLTPELEPLFWTPERLGNPSSWWGHVPFAFWLTSACKPRLLVELGTYDGVSYSAFCEAVARLKLTTRCYAVNTWETDAGSVGDRFYEDLQKFQSECHLSFSELLRMNFDAACVRFEDGSIDLLHIDGSHTSEDLCRDFDMWRTKLSDQAVVLLHGSNRKEGLGVGALFESLKKKNQHFEFLHSDGLGVVALGSDAPAVVKELCSLTQDCDIASVRKRFSHFGANWQTNALETVKNTQIAQLQSELEPSKKQIWDLTAQLQGLKKHTWEMTAQLHGLEESNLELKESIAQKEAQAAEYLYHLNRINSSAWWRFGGFISSILSFPFKFFKSYLNRAKIESPIDASRTASLPDVNALPAAQPDPLVSLVILSYGHVDYTIRCLNSIAKHPPISSIEIVVSDDCSDAPDLAKLDNVPNLKSIRAPQNLGFLRHANWAVTQTTGKYVLLLNNDTELKPGAIDALVETIETVPNVGLVGSKFVFPNGKLQEAGGIVWSDASAWNYGRLNNPARPEYNYVRDADYISGASILVPRTIWNQLGGFDEMFAPAYCEDADLAFRLRRDGFRVLFQPRSVIVHYEGISHGTDLTTGIKAYQVINQRRFKERWSAVLQSDHFDNGEHVLRARDRSKRRRVMLMIDHYAPEPDRDAGSRTMMDLIKSLLAQDWNIKFWPENLHYSGVYVPALQQLGVEVLYEPWVKSFKDWLSENGDEIDLVFVSRPTVAKNFLKTIQKVIPNKPVVFYGHDLHAARMRMQAQLKNDPKLAAEATAMEMVERRVWRDVDLVLYPSQEEVEAVKQLEPEVNARVLLPFCFDEFRSLRSPPRSPAVLFVGGFGHPPNIDAAIWLCQEIMPRVRKDIPDATLWVVGSNPAPEVKQLANDYIQVTGYVTEFELANKYSEARVAVAPLRIGAGLKLKVVEAMQQGLPLVTTSVGAQGLDKLDEAARVFDDAEALALEIIQLLRDDVIWIAQARRQSDYVRAHFSRQASIQALAEATTAATVNAGNRRPRESSAASMSPWLMKHLNKAMKRS